VSNVIGLPARRQPEEYLDRAELAAALKLSRTTVDRLRKEPGFPEEKWNLRTPRFLLSRVEAWLRERGSMAA
jgi:predicted DNA-binding transcriptional regulator AlpA